jgi:hypothetical protein
MGPMAIAASVEQRTYGFRRVDRVHVRVDADGQATAEVTGIVHRYPRTIAVPMSVANDLILAGVPLDLDVEPRAGQGNVVASRTPA